MALFIKSQTIFIFAQLFLFMLLIPSVKSATFNFPRFESVPRNLSLQGDAYSTSGYIQLTKNLTFSIGRATYAEPVRLWDSATGIVANFNTHFTFRIKMLSSDGVGADGLAFFLAPSPNGSVIPPGSGGDTLGLISRTSRFNSSDTAPFVAIEFDTYVNVDWDPSSDHVGIDINSIRSLATWDTTSLKNDSEANVWVTFNSSTQNFSVYITFAQDPVFSNRYLVLSRVVDIKSILHDEWITVGFSAATGSYVQEHKILSWEFNSTEFPSTGGGNGTRGGKGNSFAPGPTGGGNGTRGREGN